MKKQHLTYETTSLHCSARLSRTEKYYQNFAHEVKKILGVHQLFLNFCPIFRIFYPISKKKCTFFEKF